jgi:hypothetical protein
LRDSITKILSVQPFWLKPWKAFPPLPLKGRGIHGLKPNFGEKHLKVLKLE